MTCLVFWKLALDNDIFVFFETPVEKKLYLLIQRYAYIISHLRFGTFVCFRSQLRWFYRFVDVSTYLWFWAGSQSKFRVMPFKTENRQRWIHFSRTPHTMLNHTRLTSTSRNISTTFPTQANDLGAVGTLTFNPRIENIFEPNMWVHSARFKTTLEYHTYIVDMAKCME